MESFDRLLPHHLDETVTYLLRAPLVGDRHPPLRVLADAPCRLGVFLHILPNEGPAPFCGEEALWRVRRSAVIRRQVFYQRPVVLGDLPNRHVGIALQEV